MGRQIREKERAVSYSQIKDVCLLSEGNYV